MNDSIPSQRIGQLELNLLEQPIVVSFDGEDVSGNAGLLIAAQIEKLTGLIAGAAERLIDHRTQSLIKHSQCELVAQRVYQIMAGASAADDSDYARHDPALKAAVGRNPITGSPLGSQPTNHRLETTRTYRELLWLGNWLVDYYIQCHPKPPRTLTLDFDGSAIEAHGLQLKAFYRGGPYQKFMYYPLFVFDSTGWLLVAALRPGDHGEVQFTLPVLKRLVRKIREAWPNQRIIVRADGAFTDPDLYKWLDDNGVDYVLGLKHNNALLTHSKPYRKASEKKFKRNFGSPEYEGRGADKRRLADLKKVRSEPDKAKRKEKHEQLNRLVRVFGEFHYQAGSWDKLRRVICRCDFSDEGINVRYIVTSIKKMNAADVYRKLYCGRAIVEMWIKHIKEIRCDRLSCSQFKSNAFRLLLHALAYILMHQIRLQIDSSTTLSMGTLQRLFINVPVHVRETKAGSHFRISVAYQAAHVFRLAMRRLGAQSLIAA
jgi:hypothetical protein